jgi:predicted membrane chloride channel (bestrophin family)
MYVPPSPVSWLLPSPRSRSPLSFRSRLSPSFSCFLMVARVASPRTRVCNVACKRMRSTRTCGARLSPVRRVSERMHHYSMLMRACERVMSTCLCGSYGCFFVQTCLLGGFAGIFAALLLTPIELVKCRVQVRSLLLGASGF